MESSNDGQSRQATENQSLRQRPMRIGIDYTAAVRQGGGIGRYTRNLVRALAKLDTRNRYTLFVAGGWGAGDGLGSWPPNFRVRSFPLSDRWLTILWQRLRLPIPIQAVTGPLDLFHSPDFVLPPTGSATSILTVHDLSFSRLPDCYVPAFQQYLQAAVSRSVRRAHWILADSESTRRDLVDRMGIDPGRSLVVYPAVEGRFQPVQDTQLLAEVRRRYHLPERFILGLGTIQPRKNFVGLIKGFQRLLQAKGKSADLENLNLVIGGERGWLFQETLDSAAQAGLEGRVHFPGFIADEDLPALYSLARVFAFPSWYEGFGLPVLEAMASGTPVVAADNSSLPEAVGEAGLMVPAGDSDALAQALARILTDKDLRQRLVQAGFEQARRFSWEQSAARLLQLFQACGG